MRALTRPLENLYVRKPAYNQSIPRTPTYQLFGLEKGDAGAQYSVKGLPSPRRLWLLPRRETVYPSAGPSVGTYRTMSNAGANNKARTAAASDSASAVYLPDYAHLFNPNRKKDHVTPSGPGPNPHKVRAVVHSLAGVKGAAKVAVASAVATEAAGGGAAAAAVSAGCSIQ